MPQSQKNATAMPDSVCCWQRSQRCVFNCCANVFIDRI